MENFTPISGLIGGCLIGLAAILIMYFNHQICGISGIFESILPPLEKNYHWKAFFILGLFTAGVILRFTYPVAFDFLIQESYVFIFFCGFLVGSGSRLGKGCTSGHGVCGIGRGSKRSVVATIIFFLTGLITASTVYLFRR